MAELSVLKFMPRHQKGYVWFFDQYVQWQLHRYFKEVTIDGEYFGKPDRSVLVIARHVSWWDGFWGLYLNNKRLEKRFHVLMLEEQLEKRPFLNKAGAYSIAPGRQSVISSLDYTIKLLEEPGNMVLFFPQGVIKSQSKFPVFFKNGINYLLKKRPGITDIIMASWMTDYFASPRPSLYLYYRSLIKDDITDVQLDYNSFLYDCIRKQNGEPWF